jgi:hypothetical protein
MRKMSINKLKAHLAMAAFIVVALAATGLTVVGTFHYLALNLDLRAQISHVAAQSAPFETVSLASKLAPH